MKAIHLIFVGAIALAGCSGNQGWGVKGNIAGVDENARLAIEANNAGHWYVLDSIDVASNGDFKYQSESPYPGQDILRVTLPGKGSIYFPIDSVDFVDITATADNFGAKHTIAGTALATAVNRIDSMTASSSDIDILRRDLVNIITGDTTGIVAYYALGKSIDGKQIFDPNENLGNRAYGAVAQLYSMYRPEDPRGGVIRKAFFDGRRSLGKVLEEEMPVYEVSETGFFEIERYDARGKKHSLTEEAKGKTVVLNFTTYDLPNSPAINAMLNELYTTYKSKGFEIYQIAFDENEVSWREAARNLPWTAVWNAPTDGGMVLVNYNVSTLPVFYIINKEGTLVERVEDPADLSKAVAKYM